MIPVTTRVRYGLRALVYLAKHEDGNPISVHQIAQAENISVKYLENIFGNFKKAQILRSIRGADGGYLLGVMPGDLSLFDIMTALEGPISASSCIDNPRCSNHNVCSVRNIWTDLEEYVQNYLKEKKLDQIMLNDV